MQKNWRRGEEDQRTKEKSKEAGHPEISLKIV